MPLRNERAAPTFDPSKPRELNRFFEDLEQLFERMKYTSANHATEMKKYTVRYLDFNTEQLWRTFPEFKNNLKTYEEFKKAILVHYPDADGDFMYSIRDMDLLIGERQRVGINTNSEMADYHMKFLTITTWLIGKSQLSELEQQRAYTRAFQTVLLNAVMSRLQLKFPDHYPNVPYKIEAIYEAARFVLQGSIPGGYYAPVASTYAAAPITSSAPQVKNEPAIKTEDLGAFLTEFAKIMKDTLSSNQTQNQPYSSNKRCFFCGLGHADPCKSIEEYLKEGKIKKNHENRIVLPTGSYVPREIQGENLMSRVDEWHKRNPSANTILINTIASADKPSNKQEAYRLSTTERIALLEAEIYNLRAKKPIPPSNVRTRAQASRIEEIDEEEEVEQVRKEAQDKAKGKETENEGTTNKTPQRAPEHPYRNAKDATYAPPTTRNVGAPDKGNTGPAYKTLPPIHDPAIATDIFKRSMDAPITLTQRELLSLAPEIRSQVRDIITTKRLPAKDYQTKVQNLYHDNTPEEKEETDYYQSLEGFAIPYVDRLPTPSNAFVIPDPFEVYLNGLKPEEDPDMDRLIVSCTSSSVRSIDAIIDNKQKHECILDPGSQVIAMSEDVCHHIGLAYDPTIRIRLVSANNTFNLSLGLSRNVSFQVGNITVYLQVHIIRDPSYGILLGRPFDIVTQSIVRNFANADQTITVYDPNTGRRATIPTYARTRKCSHDQDF